VENPNSKKPYDCTIAAIARRIRFSEVSPALGNHPIVQSSTSCNFTTFTHRLLTEVKYFVRERLKGRNIDYRVERQEILQNEFGDSIGYIYISDNEVNRKTDGPYQT
jgi:hypothetical protein